MYLVIGEEKICASHEEMPKCDKEEHPCETFKEDYCVTVV